MSNFKINISGNSTIGAVAIGPGAKAEGSATVGGEKAAPAGERLRATVNVRGVTSRRRVAELLEKAADSIAEGSYTGAIGSASSADASGVAWTVQKDEPYDSKKAQAAFDSITGASYYAIQFFDALRNDPEAYDAAVKLAERLRAAGVKGA